MIEDPAAAVAGSGFTLLADVLDEAGVERAAAALEDVFAAEADIADLRRWRTDAHRVSYMLPAKHPVFLDLCRPNRLSRFVESVLGPDCTMGAFNGFDVPAGALAQELHRDHPDPTPGTTTMVHAVIALDPFDLHNGATRIVPGSQRILGIERARKAAHPVEVLLAPGDAVVYDACCVHGAGANRTAAPRRSLHILFTRRWVRPKWDFAASLSPQDVASLDAQRRRLLGFECKPARWDPVARRTFGPGWG